MSIAKNNYQTSSIQLRGVSVHNLRAIDLDLPLHKLHVFCGVSGSGKTSLALDTLYAEGQRRYIESFSPYTRQFLEQFSKPEAESITGIPPAIAITQKNPSRSNRTTIGSSTEINSYLALLYAQIGEVFCSQCDQPIRCHHPLDVVKTLLGLKEGVRYMLGFRSQISHDQTPEDWLSHLTDAGYLRAVVGEEILALSDGILPDLNRGDTVTVILDRLVSGRATEERLIDSLETAFKAGGGACQVWALSKESPSSKKVRTLAGQTWDVRDYSTRLCCEACNINYLPPSPQLFSFNSPLGACSQCEGYGNIQVVDMDLIVPDPAKSLREGAIAPWTTPSYLHELDELLSLAEAYDLPTDIPFRELTKENIRLITEGVAERNFGGLDGFFRWLDKRKYKFHLRIFASRWRSNLVCPTCHGDRFRAEALAVRVGGLNLAQLCQLSLEETAHFFSSLKLSKWQTDATLDVMHQITNRLKYLLQVGVRYLALDRPLSTISSGEAQRVALTTTLGASLVDMLYILDEPSVGLHPKDINSLVQAIQALRDRGNTVVVVEHEEELIRAADQIVEIGPGAGEQGGTIVFQGSPQALELDENSATGQWISGRRCLGDLSHRRPAKQGKISLVGATGNNLQEVTVDFPLGLLCLVTGVSGAGKSTLVRKTLYPALAKELHKEKSKIEKLPYTKILGAQSVEDVVMVDQSPIGRSPRSNPVTYIKAFDPIRMLFASQPDAKIRNYKAGTFSFNVEGGRCEACRGDGCTEIDMQFMADIFLPCAACHGLRYRDEILNIRYRNQNIADVLAMTAREAFGFFRGHNKILSKLKSLLAVGLDHLQLGQGANTLSGGESQRLKLASYLSGKHKGRTLFILDEPTNGLHFSDITKLLDCFDSLLDVGHSLVVIEHNTMLMQAADYIIDLGPGPAEKGGRVIATGTPEEIAENRDSITAQYLKEALQKTAKLQARL